MRLLKISLFTSFIFLTVCKGFSQTLNHTKQCFRTADFVDVETKKIVKTEAYVEVCVKFITENSARVWLSNKEFILTFSENELLETDEVGNLAYRGTGFVGEIKFEIFYLVFPEYLFHVALVLMNDVPVDENGKKFILQYKSRK